MYKLERKKRALLKEIFSQSTTTPAGVEAAWFRAQRESELDLMDELERDGFLRREEGRYLVSLTALPQITHPLAKASLSAFEKIFLALKDSYREQLLTPVRVDALAKKLGLEERHVRTCLNYMVEGSWWGGHSTDLLSAPDATITPSESILKIRQFRDVIKQLQGWQEQRLEDRKNTVPISQLRQILPSAGLGRFGVDEALVGRPKPDWYKRLPDNVRALLDEVYLGLSNNMHALPSMGLRTVIDMVCVDLVGDIGSFADKLKALRSHGYVSDREKAILEIAIDVGSASAHRGHNPSMEDINSLLDICEHLLKGVYVLPATSEVLRKAVPPRGPGKKGDKN
ncbi:MAG: DUF4145 domain-containing protein [Sulfuricaulis sp.]